MTKQTRKLDKIDVANRVAVDGTTAVVSSILAGALMGTFGVAAAPVAVPIVLAVGVVSGIAAHRRTFGTPKA